MMNRIRFIAMFIAVVMMLGSFYFRSVNVTLSILAGSAIVIISFELLHVIVSRALSAKPSKLFIVILAAIKFVILGILLWFVVVKLPIHPVAFLVGLMTMILAIGVEGIFNLARKS